MFLYLPVRKIKTLLKSNGAKRRDRKSRPLQDSLDKTFPNKTSAWKLFFLALFLGVIFCYAFWNLNLTSQTHLNDFAEKPMTKKLSYYEKELLMANEVLAQVQRKLEGVTSKANVNNKADLGLGNMDHLVSNGALDKGMGLSTELPVCLTPNIQNATIVTKKNNSLEYILNQVARGGHYRPHNCRPQHKVGILVPYRDREENLEVFLKSIHPFLIRQNLEYRIFVVEQYGADLFNRGRLLNAGFLEMQKLGHWPCVVFHDVDLLPTDDRILYTCLEVPRHMCASVLGMTKLPSYRSLFGGVAAMRESHFRKINGYSNMYWGWGGEDNNMFWRLNASGLGVTRYSYKYAKYAALPHISTRFSDYKFHILKTDSESYKEDGLSSLQYIVVTNQLRRLYTRIVVDINPLRRKVQLDGFYKSSWRKLIMRSQSWLQKEYVTKRNVLREKKFYFNITQQRVCKTS